MTSINPPDEFLKHAAECQQMAKTTRNPASKETWNRMAERWLQCAERAKSQSVTTRPRMPVRRQSEFIRLFIEPDWVLLSYFSPAAAGLFLWERGASVESEGQQPSYAVAQLDGLGPF